nr:MAG TPA: hypothetical protein [Caudoviricetes sp.]
MKKEDIEKAAEEYEDSLTYSSVKEQYDVQKAFEAGAKWSVNSVWHNVSEKPKKGAMIIALRSKYSPIILGPFNFYWKEIIEMFGLKKWAYVEDLLSNME